jgi:hypothetical protein
MRGWHEGVATVGDIVPVPLLGWILAALTAVTALLWYFFPEWAVALRRAVVGLVRAITAFRSRRRDRRRGEPEPESGAEPDAPQREVPDEEVPEVPAATLVLSADDLAARGRYREAVRERLRAIVRDLVERGVVENRPGWTVTELAYAASTRTVAGAPLGAACDVFSRIWYGQRTATASDDAAMRGYAAEVRAALHDGQRVPA